MVRLLVSFRRKELLRLGNSFLELMALVLAI